VDEKHPVLTIEYMDMACDLLNKMTIDREILNSDLGSKLVVCFFKLDDGSWNSKVQNKLESVWMKCCKQLGLKSNVIQQLVHSIKDIITKSCSKILYERVSNKSVGLLGLATDKKDSLVFLTSLIPDWNVVNKSSNIVHLHQIVSQTVWSGLTNIPSTIERSDYESCDVKPKVALFVSQIIAAHIGVLNISDDVDSDSTISDHERLELEVELVNHLAHVLNSVCYLEVIREAGDELTTMIDIESRLKRNSNYLISRLARPSFLSLVKICRQISLDQGGLWSKVLGSLLRIQFKFSEWSLNLRSMMPTVDEWTEGDLATTIEILKVAKEVNSECGMLTQTISVECGALISLGGSFGPESEGLLWLVGRCIKLASESQLDTVKEELRAVQEVILLIRADSEEKLLYSRNLADISWGQACTVASLSGFLTSMVSRCPDFLSTEMWDMACCSLVSWVASLEESQNDILHRPAVMMVAIAVFNLAHSMASLLGPTGHHPALSLPPKREKDPILPPKLKEEWEEFFSEGVFTALFPIFVTLASTSDTNIHYHLMCSLGSAIVHCPSELLLQVKLSPLFLVQDVDSVQLPDNITFMYNHLGPQLMSSSRQIQVTVAHILASISKSTVSAEDSSGEEEEKGLPPRLLETIDKGNTVLENLLCDFKVGETAGLIPSGNASHTLIMSFMLAWKVILCLIEKAGDELRPKYTEFLRNHAYMDQLLNHLFRLLPATQSLDLTFFNRPLDVCTYPSALEIQQLSGACWVSVCRHLPALARQWWQGLDKVSKDIVEKVTCSIVTPMLWKEEANAIAGAENSENMTLKIRDSVREVVATYSIDEGSMELVVSLPSNHPLGGLNVESGRRVGVDTGQWRKWMLQLTTFLTHQNGTILDGLHLWKQNVDKRFEGVEECYICFYILHGSNHQLPKLGCRTCKKKFHSACLYKWFSTSNNSSCPLCRNLF